MDTVATLPPEDPELFIPNISSEASDGTAVLPAIAIAPPLVAHAATGRAYVDRIPAGPIFQSYTTLCTQVCGHTRQKSLPSLILYTWLVQLLHSRK